MKDVDISSMGESALTSHLKGKKHQRLTSQKRSLASVPDFFGVSSQRPATTSDDAKLVSKFAPTESGEHNKLNSTKSIFASSSVMKKSVTRDETLKAEILWALKATMSHYSYKSCEGTSKLFQAMFPDSRIASQFSCGEKKCAYLICFGLAPHFRFDSFLYLHMGQKRTYQSLWKVVADLLILSHGQASVERGFSVNKQLEVENLQERSFIAQRLVQDYVQSVGGVLAVSINKPLLSSAAGARQKYLSYLDEQKRKKTSEGVALKRKELVDELDKLKKKRRRLETDVDGLVKSADKFAQKAEETGKLVWITKSNSLRRTAKEKEKTCKDVEDKIVNVVEELKKT